MQIVGGVGTSNSKYDFNPNPTNFINQFQLLIDKGGESFIKNDVWAGKYENRGLEGNLYLD